MNIDVGTTKVINVKITKKLNDILREYKNKDQEFLDKINKEKDFDSVYKNEYCNYIIQTYVADKLYTTDELTITKEYLSEEKAKPFKLEWDLDFYQEFLELLNYEIRDVNTMVHIMLADYCEKKGYFNKKTQKLLDK